MKNFLLSRLFIITSVSLFLLLILSEFSPIYINWLLFSCFLIAPFLLVVIPNFRSLQFSAKAYSACLKCVTIFLLGSFGYLVLYFLFSSGSPFIYEESLGSINTHSPLELKAGVTLKSEYYSVINNLGTLNLVFIPSTNLVTDLEQWEQLQTVSSVKVVFSIREKDKNIHYEGENTLFWTKEEVFSHPFGFPVIEDSRDKRYVLTLSILDRNSQVAETPIFVASDKLGNFLTSGKYVIEWRTGLNKLDDTLQQIAIKIQKYQSINIILFIIMVLMLLCVIILAWNKYHDFQGVLTLLWTTSFFCLTILSLFNFVQPIAILSAINVDLSLFGIYLMLTFTLTSMLLSLKMRNVNLQPVGYLENRYLNNFLLIGSLILFVALRIPFFNSNFAAQLHGDKYASYLPNALSMINNNNFFSNFNNSYVKIFSDETMTHRPTYGEFPYYSWFLFPFLKLYSAIGLENTVRTFLTTNGLALLILSYISIKRIFNSAVAGFFSLFLAISPFFQLITFITIMDLPALILFWFSLYFWSSEKYQLSFLMAGLAVMMKVSFLPIVGPMYLILLYGRFRKKQILIYAIFLVFLLLPSLLFKLLVDDIPSVSTTNALVRMLFFFTILLIAPKIAEFIQELAKSFSRYFKLLGTAAIALLALVYLLPQALLFSSQFLPELKILFSINLYAAIFTSVLDQIPTLVLPLSFGIIIAYKKFHISQKIFLLAFFVPSMIYLVLGIKVIYFHLYYKHIFVYLVYLLVSIGLYSLLASINHKQRLVSILTVILLVVSLVIFSAKQLPSYIGRPNSEFFPEIAKYLTASMSPTGKILRADAFSRTFTIYSPIIKIINFTVIDGADLNAIRENVKYLGFKGFLERNNIEYVLLTNPEQLKNFNYWFDNSLSPTTRTGILTDEATDRPIEIYTEKINEALELERRFGYYYLYRVRRD